MNIPNCGEIQIIQSSSGNSLANIINKPSTPLTYLVTFNWLLGKTSKIKLFYPSICFRISFFFSKCKWDEVILKIGVFS